MDISERPSVHLLGFWLSITSAGPCSVLVFSVIALTVIYLASGGPGATGAELAVAIAMP
jgi:hypothetical protein